MRLCTKEDFVQINALKYYNELNIDKSPSMYCIENYKNITLEPGSFSKNYNTLKISVKPCYIGSCE